MLPKISTLALTKSSALISRQGGSLLLGRSLKYSAPFLARATSGFIAYDLIKQIKAYNNGSSDAIPNIVGDGIILTMDAAEIGIESAELAGVLDGISSISGPIGMTAGAIIFVGLDIYSAVKTVEKIDENYI